MKILSSFPNEIDHVIYFEHPWKKHLPSEVNELSPRQLTLVPFSQVELNGVVAREKKMAYTQGKVRGVENIKLVTLSIILH